MADVSGILREAMAATAMTQTELARLTGVSQGRISHYIHAKLEPSERMLAKLLAPMGYRVERTIAATPVPMTYAERRSWKLHQRLARRLDAPTLDAWTAKLASNIARLRRTNRGQPHQGHIDRWEQLVRARDVRGLRAALLDPTEQGVQMREVSPFTGLLPDDERRAVLEELSR
ncbi:MAG: helix-turn-helix domain-containing protein [Propionibacteriaceae bacterium]|jgi:transcriptional regulator with XRE-family HTH domain|nr:helix-turn-helix domain-containing protein [Propionibacteriaceae bacterium]